MREKIALLLLLPLVVAAQLACAPSTGYDPKAEPREQLQNALSHATMRKPILMQLGGDWCRWCLKFNATIEQHPALSAMMNNFVWLHIYYGKEKKNEPFIRSFVPQDLKLSFPSFIMVDNTGAFVQYYESGHLEDGNEYDVAKVFTFLENLLADYSEYQAKKNGARPEGEFDPNDMEAAADGPLDQ